jgi:hypothetical protein
MDIAATAHITGPDQLHAVATHGGAVSGRTVCGKMHSTIEPPWFRFDDSPVDARCPVCAVKLGLPHG